MIRASQRQFSTCESLLRTSFQQARRLQQSSWDCHVVSPKGETPRNSQPKPIRVFNQKHIVPLLIKLERVSLIAGIASIECSVALACPHEKEGGTWNVFPSQHSV